MCGIKRTIVTLGGNIFTPKITRKHVEKRVFCAIKAPLALSSYGKFGKSVNCQYVRGMKKTILIAAAGLIGYMVWKKYQFVSRVGINFSGIDFKSFSPFIADVQFTISNPTDVQSVLNSVHGYITSNGRNLASVDVDREHIVYPNTTIVVPVRIQLIESDLLNIGLSWINNSGGNITFQGSITADGVTIPLTQTLYNV